MPRPVAIERERRVKFVLLLAMVLLPACASIEYRSRDWSQYDGPGAAEFRVEEPPSPPRIADPLQPMNRVFFDFNGALIDVVVDPLATGWRAITWNGLRRRLRIFGSNLWAPVRIVANLLQAEFPTAGVETGRFVINSTVGLLGFFDPADSWGIKAPEAEDTGQTLQAAGWDDPAYLFIPLQGPSTTRDGVGLIGDTITNIGFLLNPLIGVFFYTNKGSDPILTYEQLIETDPDPYRMARLAWSVLRGAQVEDYPSKPGSGPAEQTLQAVFMRPADPTFFRSGDTGEVEIPSTGRSLPYSYWLQPGEAPLLYVLPSLGAHRLSGQPLAMASAALKAGWSVVVISSVFHPEFMQAASTAAVPGFAPLDSHDTRVACDAIDRQLSADYPGRLGPRALSGLSMGAFDALYIAAEQELQPDDGLLHFDLFGVGAPPVSLGYGVSQLDAFYNTPLAWPADDRERHILAMLQRVAALAGGTLQPGQPLPFSEDEARFLVGLSFRITLVDVLWSSQERHDEKVLLTERDPWDREPAYREMLEYSWMEYFYAFLLPWLEEQKLATDAGDALALCDLHSIEPWLARCRTLHVYMADNDFLRRPEDDALLHRVVPPDRLHVSEGGAHLGNGWKADELAAIMADLKRDLDAAGTPQP